MKHITKVISFFTFPMIVFLAHLVAVRVLYLYAKFPNIDIPFHYLGGLSIAYTASQILIYLEVEGITPPLNRILFLVLLLSLTATVAVFWEFAEFISDQWLNTQLQPSIGNTMQDQFLGILGGMTWAAIWFRREMTGRQAGL